MQEQVRMGPVDSASWDSLSGQGLAAMLALVGAKRMDVESLRTRTRLSPRGFLNLLNWLQQEYLVDLVTSLEGSRVEEKVELTEGGEAVLLSLLERTCELPELR